MSDSKLSSRNSEGIGEVGKVADEGEAEFANAGAFAA